MNYKHLVLKIKEKLYDLCGKDPMEIKLEQYRMYGAKIGRDVRAFSPISSAEPYLIEVGENTTISTGVRFVTHDNAAIKVFENGTDLVGPVSIGKNCFIGMNVIILPGVAIADGCIVGAGSVVAKSVTEPYCVVAGNPAKMICCVKDYKEKNEDKVFDFSVNRDKKKEVILSNQNKWLRK